VAAVQRRSLTPSTSSTTTVSFSWDILCDELREFGQPCLNDASSFVRSTDVGRGHKQYHVQESRDSLFYSSSVMFHNRSTCNNRS
jgi:hypothetical protein